MATGTSADATPTPSRYLSRLRAGIRSPEAWIIGILLLGFLILRWPFQSDFLVNWDAVQFALGTESFDLEHHQPHPPGYIGYIAAGWLLNHLTHDANQSLTRMSVIAGAASPALFYVLVRDVMHSRTLAIVGALLLGTSPLLWYYSEVALTYAPETALLLAFVLAAWRARQRSSMTALLVATVMLVVLGSFRQTGMALLVPMYLWTMLSFDWRSRFLALGVATVGTLVWLVPLLWLAGGPAAYMRESAALAELAGGPTSVFGGTPEGVGRNVVLVVAGLITGLCAALLLPLLRGEGNRTAMDWNVRWLLLLWAGPALLVYLLGHTGQVGYVLFFLPGAILALLFLIRTGVTPRRESVRSTLPGGLSPALSTGLVAIVSLNAAAFLWVPNAALDNTYAGTAVASETADVGPDAEPSLARMIRQFSISDNDAHWRELFALVEQYPAEETVVLSSPGGPRIASSFRHLGYYLPDYHVLALGYDQNGVFSHLFTSHDGNNDYSIERFAAGRPMIALDEHVRYLVVADADVANRLGEHLDAEYRVLDSGAVVSIVELPVGSNLVMTRPDEDDPPKIIAVPRPSIPASLRVAALSN